MLLAFAVCASVASRAADFTLTVIHTNDLHAHVEPVAIGQRTYGGYARQATLIRQLMKTEPNPLLLNAGDTFQGTLYFNVYQGLADLAYMNRIGYQAMAVGNHEFDLGPSVLANFARRALFPMLSCNIDASADDNLRGLIKPYTVLNVGGERVGVIGATTPEAPMISSPGPTIKFLDLESSLKKAVSELSSQGINKIILLSHLGYLADQEVAKRVPGIDVIVGGHSHTLLGEFTDKNLPKSEGNYPTLHLRANMKPEDPNNEGRIGGAIVTQTPPDSCLILQGWEWGKVLGRIRVRFNAQGYVSGWSFAQPIVVDDNVGDDREIEGLVAAFRRPIDAARKQVVGSAAEKIDGDRETVRKRESAMGDVIADAMLAATRRMGADLALMNAGGIRAGLEPGPVSMEQLISVQPFGNTLVLLDLTGQELLAAFEHAGSGWERGEGMFPCVSADVRLRYDMKQAPGRRLKAAFVDGREIDPKKTYRVATNNFIANGKDGYTILASAKGKRLDTGIVDIDALMEYLKSHSPLVPASIPRVRIDV